MKKRGMVPGYIVALLIAITLLVFLIISLDLMNKTGISFIDKIKNLLRI